MTEPGTVRVRRALLSVSDKRGVVEFARGLAELGVEIVSTGGTAARSTPPGSPSARSRTSPASRRSWTAASRRCTRKLYAGLLAVRSDADHLDQAAEHDIELVDLVCVNLYPFERTAGRRGVGEAEVIENIDVGGPTMIRAAAKNYAFAAVVVNPEAYDAVLEELRAADGTLSIATREALAADAFAYTARYDTAIARWFAERGEDFPPLFVRAYEKLVDLPYGENPHQRAAYYQQVGSRAHVLSMVKQHHGKQISYNNLLDLDAARAPDQRLRGPGVRRSSSTTTRAARASARRRSTPTRSALACDPLSAFGGVVAFNRPIDEELAKRLNEQFIEVLFAPGLRGRTRSRS